MCHEQGWLNGFLGMGTFVFSSITWELVSAGGWSVLELEQPYWSSVDSTEHRVTVQCHTRELTFRSTLLSLAWLLFKLEFT